MVEKLESVNKIKVGFLCKAFLNIVHLIVKVYLISEDGNNHICRVNLGLSQQVHNFFGRLPSGFELENCNIILYAAVHGYRATLPLRNVVVAPLMGRVSWNQPLFRRTSLKFGRA